MDWSPELENPRLRQIAIYKCLHCHERGRVEPMNNVRGWVTRPGDVRGFCETCQRYFVREKNGEPWVPEFPDIEPSDVQQSG